MAKLGENVRATNTTLNVRFEEPSEHQALHPEREIRLTKRRKKPRKVGLKPGQGKFNPCYFFRWMCHGSCTLRTGCILGACLQIVIGLTRFCIYCWLLASLTSIFGDLDKVAGEKVEKIRAVNEAIIDRINVTGAKRNASNAAYVISDEVIIQQRNATVEGTTWHCQEVLILLLVYDVLFVSVGILGLAGFVLLQKWIVLGYTSMMVSLVIFRILRHMYTVQTLYEMMVLMRAYRNIDPLFAQVDEYLSENWVREVPLNEYLCALFGWLWFLILNSAALFNQIHQGEYQGFEKGGNVLERCLAGAGGGGAVSKVGGDAGGACATKLTDGEHSNCGDQKLQEVQGGETEVLSQENTPKWWTFGLFH